MKYCLCGSQTPYDQCCGPLLARRAKASSAEALMRSRYSAYAGKNAAYLLATWHPSTRPHPEKLGLDDPVSWIGLEIVSSEEGSREDDKGVVEFIAQFSSAGKIHTLHERSRFVRQDGVWLYLDGKTPARKPEKPARIGRNDPCYCGSGKKYKKCCLIH